MIFFAICIIFQQKQLFFSENMLKINNLRAAILQNYVSGDAARVISYIVRSFMGSVPSFKETMSCDCATELNLPLVMLNECFNNDFENLSLAIEINCILSAKCRSCNRLTRIERLYGQHIFIEVSQNWSKEMKFINYYFLKLCVHTSAQFYFIIYILDTIDSLRIEL